jgi:hypothetical protein
MKVHAHQPMISKFGSHVNVCFTNGRKIVSISLDDSCGRLDHLSRGTIELHIRPGTAHSTILVAEDDMKRVFGTSGTDLVSSNSDNLLRAMRWLEQTEWGFDASMAEIGGVPV